ncbi:hypothetical protein [Spirosoma sp.]|uniref:hypothetical protein n=1 Tax=Spirosoma sp. TaxID=1899569 RepID=UPI002625A437|nr:hypothetical protein [Spirosoma sp.]MCX6213031.1 hypothetical protein [Spirosoma sp.]
MKTFVTKNFLLIILILAVGFAFAIKATVFQKPPVAASPPTSIVLPAAFTAYWQAGKAEVNTYRLEQAQAGALHAGEARLIFAVEDFRTDTQIRAMTEASRDKAVPVLKTNLFRTFAAGLEDYSLATSVFTPINSPIFTNTLKVSTTAQDWSGHSYLQLNYRTNEYQVTGKSYIEPEADETYTVPKALLEDELWSRIRIDPGKLPIGEIQLIPGTITARLRHRKLEPLAARVKLEPYEGILYPGKLLKSYVIEYPTDDRSLRIIFEGQFPHTIVGWAETYPSKDNLLTSRAVLKKTVQSDYWNHNTPADTSLRAALLR